MAFHVYVFPLVVFLLLCLALLWHLSWLHLQPAHSQAGRRRTLVHRLLKPRTPLDCPICRLASSGVRPASAPVRPWGEVKSRRGAPKRVSTEGFACPNRKCSYFGITDASIHALVGMASMAVPSASRPFAVKPAVPRSLPGATPPCIV